MKRFLTDEEQLELNILNDAVKATVEKRSQWLDSKMVEIAKLKIGDDIYNLNTGRRLGKVTELYRFWRKQSRWDLDNHIDICYEFEVEPRCFDNTSRQPGLFYGPKEEVRQ